MGIPFFPIDGDRVNRDVGAWVDAKLRDSWGALGPFRLVWHSRPHIKAFVQWLVTNNIPHLVISHPGGVTEITNIIDRMNVCPKCKGSGRVP